MSRRVDHTAVTIPIYPGKKTDEFDLALYYDPVTRASHRREPTMLTTTQFHEIKVAMHGAGWIGRLARDQRDPECVKPWVVLAYRRNVANVRDFAIVAGYNRWTGEAINWIVPSFDSENYDISGAVEVSK